jgi:hypothetical protein
MVTWWRQRLSATGEPWYLLAPGQGGEAELAERGGATQNGKQMVSLVFRYGAEPGPWVKVGTWDYSLSGREPSAAERADMHRDDITDRFVLSATTSVEGPAPTGDALSMQRRLDVTRRAMEPWKEAQLQVDGREHAALRSSIGEHQILYTTAGGRCIFVHACGRPAPLELVSCTDLALLDAIERGSSD